MTAQTWSRFDQRLDYALVFQACGLHLIAFALFLAALVGSDGRGSKLLELESETARVTIGALGTCVSSEGSATFCQAASLIPQLSESYALAGMPDALQRVLRTEVPDLPSLLLFVVIFSAVTIAISTAAVLPRCSVAWTPASKLALYSRHILKGCAVANTICAIFAVTVASCFFKSGIPQLWAGCVLSGLAVLGHVGLILNAPPRQMVLSNYQWS